MWKQIASLKTVREYGQSYLKARNRIEYAKSYGTFKEVVVAYWAYHELDKKARLETGLPLKMCAGFIIPLQYEGQCA